MTQFYVFNILSALVFPFFFVLLSYLIPKVNNKPRELSVDENGEKSITDEEVNIFLKALPTAYLSNILWNFTFAATV